MAREDNKIQTRETVRESLNGRRKDQEARRHSNGGCPTLREPQTGEKEQSPSDLRKESRWSHAGVAGVLGMEGVGETESGRNNSQKYLRNLLHVNYNTIK